MLLFSLSIGSPACLSGDHSHLYYGRVVVPQAQEFRWSDGGLPQVFDPALAAAPPDTDAVRALFEGLTEYDPATLKPTPGVAERWESSEEGRVWTFFLRSDARWSTGETVTAGDFAASWERTLRFGDQAPHTDLLNDIVGARAYAGSVKSQQAAASETAAPEKTENGRHPVPRLAGVEEVGAHVLRVRLLRPNTNFPALVAHPVFRPVKITADNENAKVSGPNLVSNGAFKFAERAAQSVRLERAENYWGRSDVNLEKVEFIQTPDAEAALIAYQRGDIDAVTNAPFEPLALKLLAPYADYRKNTYAALTYYSFNTSHPPFNDIRVREALAIAVDRQRIIDDELGGASEPADTFLPIADSANGDEVVPKSASLSEDQAKARQLLADAGFGEDKPFPVIRLLINRNEQQRQVALAVANAWRSVLGIETEIISKPWDEYEAAMRHGDYDLVRRGAVMQTADETTNIRMLFSLEGREAALAAKTPLPAASPRAGATPNGGVSQAAPIETEAEALRQLTAIPIYFASSYSLVKPYVKGFETNILDAPSLKTVRIDTNFQTR